MSLNKVMLIGHLGSDPELRYTQGGQPVANFTLATNERWNDKGGQAQERTEWHRVVVWGKLAETCEKYLKKGRQAYIEGRLQTRDWEDNNGNKRQSTEIVADTVQFLGGDGGDRDRAKPSKPSARSEPARAPTKVDQRQEWGDDDIPF